MPVLAVTLVILVVVAVALPVFSGTSPSFADGTPTGQGFICRGPDGAVFVTWHGPGPGAPGTMTVDNGDRETFSIRVSRHDDQLTVTSPGQPGTISGIIDGSTLTLSDNTGSSKSCPLGTLTQFRADGPTSSQVVRIKVADEDRAAESNLTNALTSAKAIYAIAGSYGTTASLVAALTQQEPELQFTTGAASSSSGISVAVGTGGQQLVLAIRSGSGRCWYILDNDGSAAGPHLPLGTSYGASPGGAVQGSCTAGTPPSRWRPTYPASASTGASVSVTPPSAPPPVQAVDRAAQSDLINALTDALAVQASAGSLGSTASLVTALTQQEPELKFTTGTTSAPTTISVAVVDGGQQVVMATRSGDGRCWYLKEVGGPVSYGASPPGQHETDCAAASATGPWTGTFPS